VDDKALAEEILRVADMTLMSMHGCEMTPTNGLLSMMPYGPIKITVPFLTELAASKS
jgi:hypothetical protein